MICVSFDNVDNDNDNDNVDNGEDDQEEDVHLNVMDNNLHVL